MTIIIDHQFNITQYRIRVMVFNATFNNISVILWLSVWLVEETGVAGDDDNFSPTCNSPIRSSGYFSHLMWKNTLSLERTLSGQCIAAGTRQIACFITFSPQLLKNENVQMKVKYGFVFYADLSFAI